MSSEYDVAILELDRVPPIAPIEIGAIGAEWIDREITLVVFGETRDDLGGGLKRVGTGRIEATGVQTFQFAPAPSLTCRGDSGGPALVVTDDRLKIIGVASSGDNACEKGCTTTPGAPMWLLSGVLGLKRQRRLKNCLP